MGRTPAVRNTASETDMPFDFAKICRLLLRYAGAALAAAGAPLAPTMPGLESTYSGFPTRNATIEDEWQMERIGS